jgi:hypothetical protein
VVDKNFHKITGIQVELRDIVACDESGTGDQAVEAQQQQLRVNVTSVERMNRTAIQCAALRKGSNHSDIYSHYGVILVNGMPLDHLHHSCNFSFLFASYQSMWLMIISSKWHSYLSANHKLQFFKINLEALKFRNSDKINKRD